MRRHGQVIAIAVLLMFAAAGYLMDLDQWAYRKVVSFTRHMDSGTLTGSSSEQPDTALVAGNEIRAGIDDVHEYRLRHGPATDPRLIEGTARAIREYARLFGKGKDRAYVRVATEPLDESTQAVSFTVSINLNQHDYRAVYSTAPESIQENLLALREVLHKFQGDFSSSVTPVNEIRRVHATEIQDTAPLLISDPLTRLHDIDSRLASADIDPALFYDASEAYAWLAWYKSWYSDDALSNSLAADAVANLLMGSLFYDQSVSGNAYHTALVLMALNYEDAALKAFKDIEPQHQISAQLWSAYIHADIGSLRKLTEQYPEAGYVLARAYVMQKQPDMAQQALLILMETTPENLEASRYLTYIANLSVARQRLPNVFHETLQSHRRFVSLLTAQHRFKQEENSRVTWPDEPVPLIEHMRWLARNHAALVESVSATRPDDRLLDGDALRRYLTQDFVNTCLLVYDIYASKLSIYANATAIQNVVAESYPDTDAARVLTLWLANGQGDEERQLEYAESINPAQAGPFLLREMLKIYGQWDYWKVWPYVSAALYEYRSHESAGSIGSKRLGIIFFRSLHHDLGVQFLQRANSMNPYDYATYDLLASYLKDDAYIAQGVLLLGEQYPLLLAAAERKMKSEDYPAAVDLYSRATLAAPGSYAGYAGLVRAYRAQGDTKSALATCRLYLRHDRNTLQAVTMQNIIGEILLAEGHKEEALAVYENASKSYQAGALLGYARTNEQLGQMQTAERYYHAAAERYPQGSAPAQYAVFHLRQDDQAGAIKILQHGLSSNRANYYYDALINFYPGSDRLERILEIIKSVHDELPEPLFLFDLADRFSRLNEHESAATLHWMLVEQGFEPWLHAAKYVSESDMSGSNADSVEKAFEALGNEMQAQAFFAIDFMREGEFERAFNIYPKVNFQDPWDRAHRALMMTLAWKAGGLAEKRRQEIDFPALDIHPWRRQLAEYLQGERDETMILAGVSNSAEYTTAHYYIGMQRLIQGKPGEAGDHFRVSLSKGSQDPGEYYLAYRELARLENKSKDWCCTQHWD